MPGRDQIIVDGQVVDLLDPALCTPVPTSLDVLQRPDQAAAAAAVLAPSGDVMAAVTNVIPARLSDAGLIDALAATERLKAAIEARQAELLAELHKRDPQGEEFLQDEVGCALKLAPGTAHARIESAVALTSRLWDTFGLVRDGRLSVVHARYLASACADLSDEVIAKVEERVLRRACRQTPGEFKAAVRRAVARYDSKSQAERHRAAVEQRHVTREHVQDGMGWLSLYAPSDGIEIVWTALTAWSAKTDSDDHRTADQRRADALVELCGAALDLPGVPTAHGLRPSINITVAGSTLAGEDEQPGLLNGEPIPAELARRFAADPTAKRHAWLVDHTGRVLDAPAPLRSDAYTPPVRIARHVITRDQHCVWPGCRRTAIRCELDHRIPWPEGDTSADNLQALCKRHHDLKHHSNWTVERQTDGTYEWTSPTRHKYRYRPPEVPVPEPPPPPVETDDDPPPY